MIKIGILGDIGSGKSFVAKQFGYPVFNADVEVDRIYKKDRNCFIKLNKDGLELIQTSYKFCKYETDNKNCTSTS